MSWLEKYTALKTIVIKEYLRFIRIWIQTVVPPAITTALYFVIFGNLIGSQIDDIDGHKYMDYIVPGLILMSVITNSYSNVVSSFYSAKFQKSIEELLVSPNGLFRYQDIQLQPDLTGFCINRNPVFHCRFN